MKKIIQYLMLFILIECICFVACKKEMPCEGCITKTDKPPIAIAGPDQVITLPTDSVLMDGRKSSDPDGIISSYLWTKISGPTSFNIVKQSDSITKVKALIVGTYQFELKVTDNGGLSAKDTMRVIVNAVVSNNLPPLAIAGNDTTIQTNQTSCTPVPITITLNGTNSYDPDGSVSSYLWIGPNGITNPNSAGTTITGTFQGTISVILKVTDNNGATGFDTVRISIIPANRPLIPAQLIPIGTLSQARSSIVIGAAGTKILFAGGGVQPGYCASSRVDILDLSTNTWTIAELSQARYGMGVASVGNRIFFGGGFAPGTFAGSNPPWCYISSSNNTRSSTVDIYDVSTNSWATSQLSSARVPEGAAAGNKVIFAGGDAWNSIAFPSNVIDTYNGSTNIWTPSSLSESKGLPQIATSGNKMFLAGGAALMDGDYFSGITKRIDIYDAVTGQWSVDYLSVERASMGSIGANNKIYWGGGIVANPDPYINYNPTSLVEIRDLTTNTTSFDCLSEPRDQLTAIRKDNKIIFLGKYNVTKFDIYDLNTNSWSIGVMPQSLYSASVISYNNIIYVAGSPASGVLSNQVWKLEF